MERRTFLGTCARLLGIPAAILAGSKPSFGPEPVRPMRSKPYMEMGRPDYEEPPGWTIDNETFRIIIGDDGYPHLVGPRQDEEWAQLGLRDAVTRIKGPVDRRLRARLSGREKRHDQT